MTFNLLIVSKGVELPEARTFVVEQLARVLESSAIEFDDDAVESMVSFTHCRHGVDHAGPGDQQTAQLLCGVTIDVPDESASLDSIQSGLLSALGEVECFSHVLRFEDSNLQIQLSSYANIIFRIEMKLRRVLSYIYLHAFQNGKPFELLSDERAQTQKDMPASASMANAAENQFFYLSFGHYGLLNQRGELKAGGLRQVLAESSDFESFKSALTRPPVADDGDAEFIAGLKERMASIEAVRNCVAHNRSPNRRQIENFDIAIPLVDRLLDHYLERWSIHEI